MNSSYKVNLIKNLERHINNYIIIENNLRIFPLLPGDVAEIINYSDSYHVQKKIFNELISVRLSERKIEHGIIKTLINTNPITLSEIDVILQNCVNKILEEK
jgi:hypothetical protein